MGSHLERHTKSSHHPNKTELLTLLGGAPRIDLTIPYDPTNIQVTFQKGTLPQPKGPLEFIYRTPKKNAPFLDVTAVHFFNILIMPQKSHKHDMAWYLLVHKCSRPQRYQTSGIHMAYSPASIVMKSPAVWLQIESLGISLGARTFCANPVGFQWSSSLLPCFCPLCVPEGGGMWGIFGKLLKRAIQNTPGLHAVLTTYLTFSSVLVPVLLAASFCQQAATMPVYKFTPRAVASPDAPQKPLVRKRARCGGETWTKVTWHPATQAKNPRTAGSQQPACSHKEHQILMSAEATSFASQFWDCKEHPTKASQHVFFATCIDVDLEKTVNTCTVAQIHQKEGASDNIFCTVPWSTSTNLQNAAPFAQKCDLLLPHQSIHF